MTLQLELDQVIYAKELLMPAMTAFGGPLTLQKPAEDSHKTTADFAMT